jgi:hypothetical protein
MDGIRTAWWYSIWEFALHVSIGVAIFAMVTAGAIGVHLVVVWASEFKLNGIVLNALEIVEIVVFASDILIFLIFIVKTTWKAIKAI